MKMGIMLSYHIQMVIFYTQQRPFFEKLKKIWAIICNKDFYYSDIVMTKEDFKEFKEWINRN